jgi:hypothetical protein
MKSIMAKEAETHASIDPSDLQLRAYNFRYPFSPWATCLDANGDHEPRIILNH